MGRSTHRYGIDGEQLQVIRFDPTDMRIIAAIPIEGTEREGYITEHTSYPIVSDDGVYFAAARIIRGPTRGVPDCGLRLRAGEQTFDDSWYLDINERTGGRPADAVIAGAGGSIWLSVFHAEQLEETPRTSTPRMCRRRGSGISSMSKRARPPSRARGAPTPATVRSGGTPREGRSHRR